MIDHRVLNLDVDPMLDFQGISCTKNYLDRLIMLSAMINSERRWLEAKSLLKLVFEENKKKSN